MGATGGDERFEEPGGMTGGALPGRVWLVAAALVAVLMVFAGRYGYHRDELYFIEAGRHPAWGYPDQPPLVPLLAAAWDWAVGGHLWAFRLVPALAAGGAVLVGAATSRALGGSRRGQLWTAIVTALCAFGVAMGHVFSTSTMTYLLTAWTILLVIRAVDSGTTRAWLAAGLVGGVSMQVQTLPAIMLACCALALAIVGPREVFRARGAYLAAGVFAVVAAPNLIYQAVHGWPQLEVAASIAAGGSTSSVPRWQVIPFQLVIIGPFLSVVLLAGLWALLAGDRVNKPVLEHREVHPIPSPALRQHRWIAGAFLVFLVVVTITGGKPYYASGFVPALFAAGVGALLPWIQRTKVRRASAALLLIAHTAGTALISLPLAPAGSAGFQVAAAVQPDTAETVGWNGFTQLAAVLSPTLPPGSIVLTGNYGEAGALDRARRHGATVLPVFSGHNAYGEWGPPPATTTHALVIGWFEPAELSAWFQTCTDITTFPGVDDVDNDERGVPFRLCAGPLRPWNQLWPQIRHLG